MLWTPSGGETVLTNVATTVKWHVWGNQIRTADVWVSSDGGNVWSAIREGVTCSPGWNYCSWIPGTPCNNARVRVRGYDSSGNYIAGDGSRDNVIVHLGPRPVQLYTILVKTKTDAHGHFSAPHGLERYTPDGYAIRAVSVAVQHRNGNWHTLVYSHSVDNRFWWNDDVVAGVIASPDFCE